MASRSRSDAPVSAPCACLECPVLRAFYTSFAMSDCESSSGSLATRTTFIGDAGPDTISTSCRLTPIVDASSLQIAWLALPASGGAATRIFSRSPSTPAIASREAPGTALTRISQAPSSAILSQAGRSPASARVDWFVAIGMPRDCLRRVIGRFNAPAVRNMHYIRIFSRLGIVPAPSSD